MSGLTIGYDARPLQPETRHCGPGVVVENLLARLGHDFQFVGVSHDFASAAEMGIRTWPAFPKLKNLFFEASPLFYRGYDMFWGTNHFLPHWLRRPSVLTVYDLLLLNYPDDQPWSSISARLLTSSMGRATKIVTVSRTIADELLAQFSDLRGKVEVVLLGFELPMPPSASPLRAAWSMQQPYALMLGCDRPRKNLALALSAVGRLAERGKEVCLVVTGSVHSSFEGALDKAGRLVKRLGVLPRRELSGILGGATALLFPSRYEGFGLPILEAMAAGCPVLALDTRISHEVGGEAARFLPDDALEWANAIYQLMNSPSLREEMTQKGFQNLKRFSWERTALAYSQIFREVAR